MSAFTDRHLEILKGHLSTKRPWYEKDRDIKDERLRALVARLEAAEDAVEQAYRCNRANREYYSKWREAAGK